MRKCSFVPFLAVAKSLVEEGGEARHENSAVIATVLADGVKDGKDGGRHQRAPGLPLYEHFNQVKHTQFEVGLVEFHVCEDVVSGGTAIRVWSEG